MVVVVGGSPRNTAAAAYIEQRIFELYNVPRFHTADVSAQPEPFRRTYVDAYGNGHEWTYDHRQRKRHRIVLPPGDRSYIDGFGHEYVGDDDDDTVVRPTVAELYPSNAR